ncbi:hypothetical protein EMIHUDRAFT_248191 [Emiliania huxleyi CCMP1516]|uniref:Uncharacterized protein n=2 Tax=Emiliania huxleyi TaxID=2903 RepID=A0A0D3IHT4_EMIH1|nr:hypothetical protein EMIHUDRAFT_248191 [Emiliania huxleyi CCMP1516]EOD10819.1 hypothetical protein EMIHUDRAFT_248191 [Emiliania huxleyi CCMP1516]|eukprot:XP_005763248.1 hypothetical protein EMIHUDRAFT_248191 [Emiliania huxleyi CCMP1516]
MGSIRFRSVSSPAAVLRGRRSQARWARSAFPSTDLADVLGFNFTNVWGSVSQADGLDDAPVGTDTPSSSQSTEATEVEGESNTARDEALATLELTLMPATVEEVDAHVVTLLRQAMKAITGARNVLRVRVRSWCVFVQ